MDRRPVFDARQGEFLDCAIYDRAGLSVGARLNGPLIVSEKETSTYVSPRYSVTLQQDGCLWIERRRDGES
jgi:N-methylhydantoinase A